MIGKVLGTKLSVSEQEETVVRVELALNQTEQVQAAAAEHTKKLQIS